MTADLPGVIQAEVEHLHEHTGHTADVEQVSRTRYRLTVETERVRMTVDFKVTPGGRAVWAASTLAVDGEPRPLARDPQDLARILADPDQKATLRELLPDADPATAPPQVRHFHRVLAGLVPAGMLRIGTDGGTKWIVALQAEDRTTGLQMIFRRQRGKSWSQRLRVVLEGVNRSDEVGDDISKALALLAGNELIGPPQTAPTVGASPTEPKRYGSVEQRRHSVIRN